MKKKKKQIPTVPNPHTVAIMQASAHLSTSAITSQTEVLMFEVAVLTQDIERLAASMTELRHRRAKSEACIAGLQAVVAKR